MHCFLSLTHFIPLLYFYTSWKHQKTRFADVFRDYRKRPLVWNVLMRKAFIKTWLIKKASECSIILCYFEFPFHFLEAVARRYFVKKMFLKISQNLLENTFTRVSFLINCRTHASNFIKKILWHSYFPVDFAKFLRAPILQNTSGGCVWYQRSRSIIVSINCVWYCYIVTSCDI